VEFMCLIIYQACYRKTRSRRAMCHCNNCGS
jgi:hypothetical protein